MPEAANIAPGADVYRVFVLPIPLDHDQDIAAIEVRPGNRKIVHHARMYVDTTDESRRRDALDPEPGFFSEGGNDIRKPGLGAWLPGSETRLAPDGLGQIVKRNSDLLLLMHYHGTGKPETDRSSVAFYFSKTPVKQSFQSIPLSTANIDIPAGEADHVIRLRATVPADVHAYSVLPHGHYLLRSIKLWAVLPSGKVERMLWIDDWDFNWQGNYHFREPIALPKGTQLHVIAHYDNSSGNPSNPTNPPKRVRYGPKAKNEMLGCHIQIAPDSKAAAAAIAAKWPKGL